MQLKLEFQNIQKQKDDETQDIKKEGSHISAEILNISDD